MHCVSTSSPRTCTTHDAFSDIHIILLLSVSETRFLCSQCFSFQLFFGNCAHSLSVFRSINFSSLSRYVARCYYIQQAAASTQKLFVAWHMTHSNELVCHHRWHSNGHMQFSKSYANLRVKAKIYRRCTIITKFPVNLYKTIFLLLLLL